MQERMKKIIFLIGKYLFFISIFLVTLLTEQGSAKVYIDINAPTGKRLSIAIPDIKNFKAPHESSDVGIKLRDILTQDLDFSGFFDIIDKKAYIEDPNRTDKASDEIDFKDWKVINAEVLIKGSFVANEEELTVELKLFDVFQEKMLVGRRYVGKKTNMRAIVHKFADEVIEALTGEKGVFDTKLLFISNASGNKEIYVSDYDGYNVKQITKNNSINLSPQWSPDGKRVLYTSYKEGQPYLYMMELATGGEIKLSSYPGLNIGARWSPTGREVAMTLSKDGNPELYILALDGMKLKRLTNNWAIDTSPTWSPDGNKLAFVSDIGGNPHIYVINSDGTGLSRLTFEGKYNAAPAWSPKGDKIAFARMNEGKFDIWVMNADGNSQSHLTSGTGDNESPSWSPDGRYIVFASTRNRNAGNYIMQSNGENQRQIRFEDIKRGEQTSPTWSPYLSANN